MTHFCFNLLSQRILMCKYELQSDHWAKWWCTKKWRDQNTNIIFSHNSSAWLCCRRQFAELYLETTISIRTIHLYQWVEQHVQQHLREWKTWKFSWFYDTVFLSVSVCLHFLPVTSDLLQWSNIDRVWKSFGHRYLDIKLLISLDTNT